MGGYYYLIDTNVTLTYKMSRHYCRTIGGTLADIETVHQQNDIRTWLTNCKYSISVAVVIMEGIYNK